MDFKDAPEDQKWMCPGCTVKNNTAPCQPQLIPQIIVDEVMKIPSLHERVAGCSSCEKCSHTHEILWEKSRLAREEKEKAHKESKKPRDVDEHIIDLSNKDARFLRQLPMSGGSCVGAFITSASSDTD